MSIFFAVVFSKLLLYKYEIQPSVSPDKNLSKSTLISSDRYSVFSVKNDTVREMMVGRSFCGLLTTRMMTAYGGQSSSILRVAFCAEILARSKSSKTKKFLPEYGLSASASMIVLTVWMLNSFFHSSIP